MAMQTKTIKQKMKSVSNIGKITKAMEMISISKMKKSVLKRNNSLLFAEESLSILENIYTYKGLTHKYLEKGDGDKLLIIVVASNKGLCGGYNINISKKLSEFIKNNPKEVIDVISIGRQAKKAAIRNNTTLVASFDNFSDYYSTDEIHSLLYTIFEKYDSGDYKNIRIVYTEFMSSISFEARIKNFIPLSIKEARKIINEDNEKKNNLSLYSFEPNEQEVLDTVVPTILNTILYQYLLESLASEHSSRVSAMRNASDNAIELVEELKINFNRARQAAITQEIAEIVGGSSALS